MTDASITSLRERHLPHAVAAVEHELILAKRVRDACGSRPGTHRIRHMARQRPIRHSQADPWW